MNTPENPAPQPAAAQSAGTDAPEWTVDAADYDKLLAAAQWLRRACKDRLTPGHYAKLDEECAAIDALISPQKHKAPSDCPTCDGKGGIDSGGVTPWGAGIDIPCPSCAPPRPGPSGEPHAAGGLRDAIMAVLIEPATGSRTVRELADRILALLTPPAPVSDAGAEDSARWKPMSEFDAKTMQFVLLHQDGAIRLRLWNGRSWECDNMEEVYEPTHFRELPDVPGAATRPHGLPTRTGEAKPL